MTTKTLTVLFLLFVFVVTVFMSVNTKSPICDEAAHHIAAGYSYIKTHDFRITPSPPLIRLLIGIPLVFLNPKLPLDHISWAMMNGSEFGYQFLFIYNHNADQIVFFSRLPMIILATLLGLLIFIWAGQIYGYKAGLFALFLYTLSPTILGNAGLAMLDMGCAAFIFAAVYQFYRFLKKQTVLNLLLTGILFGLAQATKLTALILYPTFIIFIIVHFLSNRDKENISLANLLKNVIFIWAVGILVLWATYFFEFKPLLKNEPHIGDKIEFIKRLPLSKYLIRAATTVPVPLSTYINSIFGFGRQIIVGDQALSFMGKKLASGSKTYYLILYSIKTPLSFIIFLILTAILLKRTKRTDFSDEAFLVIPILAVFLTATFSKLQGGIRYLLPLYPFLLVWVSKLVTIEVKKRSYAVKGAFYGLCLWYVFSSITAYPHYLAYFNELVGSSDGFGYKITSDTDWGQDFKELKRYIDKNNIKSIKLLCFGAVDPAYYGIRYEELSADEYKKPIAGKYYAISTFFLPNVKWANEYNAKARVAHTIFIYHIKGSENEPKN